MRDVLLQAAARDDLVVTVLTAAHAEGPRGRTPRGIAGVRRADALGAREGGGA